MQFYFDIVVLSSIAMFESLSLILAFWVRDYMHSNTDMRNRSGE